MTPTEMVEMGVERGVSWAVQWMLENRKIAPEDYQNTIQKVLDLRRKAHEDYDKREGKAA